MDRKYWWCYYGGAIHGYSDVTLEISNTQLNNNKASGGGGAIYIWQNSQILITNSSLDANTANHGGAISGLLDVTLVISNTQLNNNNASDRGGAIRIYWSVQLLITNSRLDGNGADNGGAIYGYSNVTLVIDQSIFTRNAISSRHAEKGSDVALEELSSLEVRYALIFVV